MVKLLVLRGGRPSLPDSINTTSFAFLLAFLIVGPFPWGAVLLPGKLRIELVAFTVAALAFAARNREHNFGGARIPIAAGCATAVVGVIQLIPLPTDVLRTLSPGSARAYEDANAIMVLFARPAIPPRISIAPSETFSAILMVFAHVALFSAAAILASTRQRRRWLAGTLIAASATHAAVAFWFAGPSERLRGTFVNSNHFAGYLQIALAFAMGMVWSEVLTGSSRGKLVLDRAERLEMRVTHLILRILVWSLLATAIALTRSRAGLIAAASGALLMLTLGAMRRGGRYQRASVAAAGSGIAIVAFVTAPEVLSRFVSTGAETTLDVRQKIWRSSLEAWKLFPHFGDGLGAFKEAYRRVQPADVTGLVEQAHNDFLQLLVTGGWIGALFGVIAFASIYVILFRGWLRQTHREESAFILAGLGALFALTVHGLVEFNMSIPAIPATLAVMLGASVAATQHRTER